MSKERKSSKKRMTKSRLGMTAIAFVCLIFLCWTMKKSNALKKELASYHVRRDSLELEKEKEEERAREIKELERYMQTDEYVEQVARERFGLVKENEIVFEELK